MEKKGWLLGVLVAGLALLLMATALLADETLETPDIGLYPIPEDAGLNYSINIGAALFTGKNIVNTDAFMLGVAWYGAADTPLGTGAALGLSGDWIPFQRADGKTVNIVPVLFNYRKYGIISNWRVFFNVGVGVLGTTESSAELRLDKGANFGWTAGLGVDVTNELFFNARFIGGEHPEQDGFVGLQLGYRF